MESLIKSIEGEFLRLFKKYVTFDDFNIFFDKFDGIKNFNDLEFAWFRMALLNGVLQFLYLKNKGNISFTRDEFLDSQSNYLYAHFRHIKKYAGEKIIDELRKDVEQWINSPESIYYIEND